MLKRDELTDPTSCINKAADDELVFVLRAKDAAAPATIRAWIKERVERGMNVEGDAKLIEAERCAEAMERWHGKVAGKHHQGSGM
jgi:hypothetical protein